MKKEFSKLYKLIAFTSYWLLHLVKRYKKYSSAQLLRELSKDNPKSLIPVDETAVIFVHIPKCAGVSIRTELYGNMAGGHISFRKYLQIFGPVSTLKYFKFTFVRNPWDRLLSSYFYLKQGGYWAGDERWFAQNLAKYSSFESFVLEWLNEGAANSYVHFRPQVNYLRLFNSIDNMDYIGFFENISSDIQYVSSRTGRSISLKKTNKSNHLDYKTYYSNEMIDHVYSIYSADIIEFEYCFDNSNLERQVKKRDEFFKIR